MEENKNGTQEQPEQKKKKKSDVILTIALVVAIAVFCYAAYITTAGIRDFLHSFS